MKIALIGFEGFVGKALFNKLKDNNEVIGINRNNFNELQEDNYDIIINSAMPSKRFWALNNPLEDFEATVKLTAEIVYNWKYKKLIQISTVSARCQLDHPYGINKLTAETLVLNHSKKNLIIRLGGLFGEGLDKGVIFDILEGNELFLNGDSKYNYISTKKAAEIIAKKLDQNGIIDVGAKDQISLKEIADDLNLDPKFGDKFESQHTENPDEDYPEAKEVLKFIKNE